MYDCMIHMVELRNTSPLGKTYILTASCGGERGCRDGVYLTLRGGATVKSYFGKSEQHWYSAGYSQSLRFDKFEMGRDC